MKNPPTLADACVATALDKRFNGSIVPPPHKARQNAFCAVMTRVSRARKFVLDVKMSAYLAELSVSFWRGGLRKRNRMLDNVRQMARLPHELTWIELDFSNGYMPRSKALGSLKVQDIHGNEPPRFGWLLEQHPKIETSFRCIEARSATNPMFAGRAMLHPVAMAWSSTDDPLAYREFGIEGATSEWVVGIEGYLNDFVHWTSAFENDDAAVDMLKSMEPPPGERHPGWEMYCLPRLPVRDVWALLATINDLPVTFEHVEPARGYISKGSYKKFLKHSIVHLTIPETRWRKLIFKTAAILRRRAHQVRGHWRIDWRARPIKTCEHIWNEQMICSKCGGHMLWIAEHQRGDASLGFVTHDYDITHSDETVA